MGHSWSDIVVVVGRVVTVGNLSSLSTREQKVATKVDLARFTVSLYLIFSIQFE